LVHLIGQQLEVARFGVKAANDSALRQAQALRNKNPNISNGAIAKTVGVSKRLARQVRQREIANLHFQVSQQRAWQRNVDRAANAAVRQQQTQKIMADLEQYFNPRAPEPEPEIVYVEADEGSDELGTRDFNPKLWMQKPRSWF
jgi:primosomal protein N'